MRPSRPLIVLVAALALLLAACGVRLEHDVVVAADGSGSVECLFLVDEGDAELDAPRAGYLSTPPAGWTQTPVDDGPYEGTRSTAEFSDPDELVALVDALNEAGEDAEVGAGCFGLDTDGPEPLLEVDAATATWTQRFDTEVVEEGEVELDIDEGLDEITDFEISVRLPGSLDEHDGDDVAADGTVTWRRDISDPDDLQARSLIQEADNRLAGVDRYATAAAISSRFFDPGAGTVFVADGHGFADALAASGAAGSVGAPVLLTATDALPDVTRAELERLGPERIVVLGGEAAVGSGVEAELGGLADDVDRLAGANRYETALAVADDAFDDAETVLVATGASAPDALAGAAAAAQAAGPVLLTVPDALPVGVRAAIGDLAPSEALVLGGRAAVAESVAVEVGDLAP